MARDQQFNIRLDDADRARLDAVAAHYGTNASTALRTLLIEKVERLRATQITQLGADRCEGPADR